MAGFRYERVFTFGFLLKEIKRTGIKPFYSLGKRQF
jgi:hypothetical protein